ncbi:hypothetical protein FRUB_08694 [Fimbriiglobus ruber]|uniref:DUF4351 domain-containing protein n=2 Tax=Fimbriiglobus ruber TaxID=1908690 RepID=A0A225D3G3_9BACT|nr:hypothetical protein FRUB_08694 [Fimbriiglobus ruber]
MEESATYQAILARGEARGEVKGHLAGERAMILRLGSKKFGSPSVAVAESLAAITDLARLEELGDRILDAAGWDELLETK